MTVDKATVERELGEAWAEIVALVDSFSETEQAQPGVVDDWSIKDLLGHMAFWAEKAAADLRSLSGGRPEKIEGPSSVEELNDWNAREAEARAGKSLADLRAEWEKTFKDAAAEFRGFDAGLLETEVRGWSQLNRFLGDTTLHYKEHAEQIRAWKRQLETTEG